MATEKKTFQIFLAGTHTAMNGAYVTIDRNAIKGCADVYNPSRWAAPLVLGHPENNAPSYGKVLSLSDEGDILYATAEVDTQLIEWVRAGLYLNRSASFYSPGAPGNPNPGFYYLRHVGFLGATPPAVKGLAPLNFAESNPLIADALARSGVCFSQPSAITSQNPLIADAERRRLQAALPNTPPHAIWT